MNSTQQAGNGSAIGNGSHWFTASSTFLRMIEPTLTQNDPETIGFYHSQYIFAIYVIYYMLI